MFWNRDQITEYAIKSLQAFQLMIPFLYTLDCHLLNVAGCVTQTLNTFEITHFLRLIFVVSACDMFP